jgi:hypothetical protein
MSDGEQKEEKPKKMFVVVHTIWEDGEMDTEMYEFRKNQSGRGAPGKWRLNGADFSKRVEELLGDPSGLLEEMSDATHLGSTSTPSSVKPITQPKVKTKKQADDGIGDIEFGDDNK